MEPWVGVSLQTWLQVGSLLAESEFRFWFQYETLQPTSQRVKRGSTPYSGVSGRGEMFVLFIRMCVCVHISMWKHAISNQESTGERSLSICLHPCRYPRGHASPIRVLVLGAPVINTRFQLSHVSPTCRAFFRHPQSLPGPHSLHVGRVRERPQTPGKIVLSFNPPSYAT